MNSLDDEESTGWCCEDETSISGKNVKSEFSLFRTSPSTDKAPRHTQNTKRACMILIRSVQTLTMYLQAHLQLPS